MPPRPPRRAPGPVSTRIGRNSQSREGQTTIDSAAALTAKFSWYRATLLLGLAAAIAQVALGGVVRVTGSGDACPDWPLCHGQIIPPWDLNIWLEFSHRLSATALGALVLIATLSAWRRMRGARVTIVAISTAMALVIAAAILGGLTVLTELAWWARLIHLALAELVVACLVIAWLADPTGQADGARQLADDRRTRTDRSLGPVALVALLAVILYGSYVVGFNYGAACTSWPMCQGSRIPEALPFVANMGHRVSTLVAAVLVFWLCQRAWGAGSGYGQPRAFALVTAICMAAAIALGALMVWLDFSALMRSLHLVIATLVWASTVGLVAVRLDPIRFRAGAFDSGRIAAA